MNIMCNICFTLIPNQSNDTIFINKDIIVKNGFIQHGSLRDARMCFSNNKKKCFYQEEKFLTMSFKRANHEIFNFM